MRASSRNISMKSALVASCGRMRLITTIFWKPGSPDTRARKISAMPPVAIRFRISYLPRRVPEGTSNADVCAGAPPLVGGGGAEGVATLVPLAYRLYYSLVNGCDASSVPGLVAIGGRGPVAVLEPPRRSGDLHVDVAGGTVVGERSEEHTSE